MNILTLDHITKSYTGRKLFEDASFYLQEGEKVGVLGINGTGKSTLLRIISGLEEPDEGKVICAGNVTVQMLVQSPEFAPEDTVMTAVMRSHVTGKQAQVTDVPAMEARAKSMLMKLGITEFDMAASHLSGGQKKKIALVGVLLHQSDILVLDEPTNHLDIASREALEDALSDYDGTMLIVSHDRYFINRMAQRMVWLRKDGAASVIGGYDALCERMKREEQHERQATLPSSSSRPASEKENGGLKRDQAVLRRKISAQLRRTEQQITLVETAVDDAKRELERPETSADYQKVLELSTLIEQQEEVLLGLMEEWENLQNQLDTIG